MNSFVLLALTFICYGALIGILKIVQFRYETAIYILENKVDNLFTSKEDLQRATHNKATVFVGDIHKHPNGGEPLSIKAELETIKEEVNKGYDLYTIHSKEDIEVMGWHKHLRSSELFYCYAGTATLSLKDKKGNIKNIILKQGDSFYIRKKVPHSVFMHKNSDLIVIAKPSLITRLGALYEKIF